MAPLLLFRLYQSGRSSSFMPLVSVRLLAQELRCTVALSLFFIVINQTSAVHAFDTLAFCGDTSSVKQFQTALAEQPRFPFRDCHFNIIINDDHFGVLHRDLGVLLLRIENVVVEVTDMLATLALGKPRCEIVSLGSANLAYVLTIG